MAADTGGVEVAGCAPLALTANVEASATPDATRHKPVRAVFPLAIGLSPLRSKMRIASEQAGVVGAFTRNPAYRKSAPACASGPLVEIGRDGIHAMRVNRLTLWMAADDSNNTAMGVHGWLPSKER
jgi:hypothetical protein